MDNLSNVEFLCFFNFSFYEVLVRCAQCNGFARQYRNILKAGLNG